MEDRAWRRCDLPVCGVLGLQCIGEVQIPYFFDRMADLISQKPGDLRAECDVIKNKTADVMFFVMLDYEKAFVGYRILAVHVPQNSNFSLCRLLPSFLGRVQTGGQFGMSRRRMNG
jgi:hypothetical protein